jgi:hypothetical protein
MRIATGASLMGAGPSRTGTMTWGPPFFQAMQSVDAFLFGLRPYQVHAEAFELMAPGDPFGDLMNAPKKSYRAH